jgi:hypothetical protein
VLRQHELVPVEISRVCVADHNADGQPRCQEVRALLVDAEVERLVLAALAPDRIALAVAALGEVEEETSGVGAAMVAQARAGGATMPSARVANMTLSSPRIAWWLVRWSGSGKSDLRRADQIEQEYGAWRREQAVSISDGDRQEILTLGEDLPRLWHAATTRSADRKQIVRLVIKEVALDQKRRRGYVWIKVIWQTGAASEHWLQRRVQSYAQHADQDRLRQRIAELNGLQKMDTETADILNKEALRTAHGPPFSGNMVHCLRKRWGIPTVKINGKAANPPRWPDGTYSVQGAAAAIGLTPQVIFDWLRKGWLTGKQLAKGLPWQIALSPEQAIDLRARVRRTTRSSRGAS